MPSISRPIREYRWRCGRRPGARGLGLATILLALAGAAGVAATATAPLPFPDLFSLPAWWSGVPPRTGLPLVVVGLATRGASDEELERLAEKVEQLDEGETDVEFGTARDGGIGRLADALEELAATMRSRGREREESEQYRRQLYDVTSDTSLTDEEKVDRLLELGCERLGVENGHVVRIDEASGSHEIVAAAGSDFVTAGTVTELSQTFCRNTITSDDILDVYNAPAEGYGDDPAYERWEISCYVGGRIEVGDELYGTVCFVDAEPRDEPFTHLEKTFVDQIARWLSHLFERRANERQLRAEKERFESLVQGVDEYAIFLLDTDGRIRSWNPGAERIKGYEAEEILGEHLATFYTDADREAGLPEENLAAAREAGSTEAEGWRVRKDGSRFWASATITALYDDDGTLSGFAKVTRDMTERREYERQLETERDRFSALFENTTNEVAHVELPAEGDVVVRSVNACFTETFGYDTEAAAGRPLAELVGPPDSRDDSGGDGDEGIEGDDDGVESDDADGEGIAALARRARRGERIKEEVTRLATDGEREFIVQFVPIGDAAAPDEGYAVYTDVTERKERERALESLQAASRALLTTGTDAGTAELVVETAEELLDVAGVAVYLLDEASNRLEPAAHSRGFADGERPPPVAADGSDSLLWDCFVTDTPMVLDDAGEAGAGAFATDATGGLLVPIGDHGVFVVTTREGSVDDGTRWLVQTLVATTAAAFDRIRSEAELRESDAALEDRNRRLQRQLQIDGIIRRIDQSLIDAGSRAEIETAVCERLVEAEDVAFAWIGRVDAAGEALEPRAWAGGGESYLDAVPFRLDATTEPAAATAATEDPTVVSNVIDDLKREAWRKDALATEFHSVVAVPLAFEEYFYGVLAVYADEPEAFTELERTVFAELGETIAHSINAVETQRALHADTLVELSLRLEAEETFLGTVARAAGCDVEYEGLATHSEEETRLFLTASGADPDDLKRVFEDLVSVRDYRLVADGDGENDGDGDGDTDGDGDGTGDGNGDGKGGEAGALFEVAVAGRVVASRLVRHGGTPRSIRVVGSAMEVVVQVPTSTDVREFVEMLSEAFPSVELVSRRSVERTTHTRQELVASLFERLTDRQVEVLRTAYYAGFFEWPRESTGEDVAAMLGVSQPTVNRHLRLGQDRLLEQLFEADPAG